MAEQAQSTSSPVDAGSIGSGFSAAGASTFNTAVSWLTYGQETKKIGKWRSEDKAIAEQARKDDLAQQARENKMLSQQFDFTKAQAREQTKMAQESFDFGKYRWGEEFGFTQKQYQEQMKLAKSNEKRTQQAFDTDRRRMALTQTKDTLNNILADDIQMKQYVASNMGA